MKSLTSCLGLFSAIAITLTSGLIQATSSQTATFTYEEVSYTVDFKETRGQNLAFSLSYAGSNGNTHIVEYQGTCGADTIGVLGQTVINSEGKVISQNRAAQPIIFDINPNNRDWEMSGAIREALALMCNSTDR